MPVHFVPSVAITALALVVLVTGCATQSLSPKDRAQVCRVDVDIKYSEPVFQANPLSSGAGWLTGAGIGALQGLTSGVAGMVTVPLGAFIGAGYGAACAAGSLQHPLANADFERFLQGADRGLLKRVLAVELNVPRVECIQALVDGSANSTPDAVVEIEKVESGMACLISKQEYWISVQWRAVGTKSGSVMASATTRCSLASFRSVGEWFADRDYARAEIERLLGKVGQRVALELFEPPISSSCSYRSLEHGELE